MMMDPELKKKWVEALRSGEYEQCRSALSVDGKYCCLGVLCDLQEPGEADGDHKCWPVGDADLAGYVYSLPPFRLRGGLLETQAISVACMNDQGRSFAEIADYIEEHC